MEIGFVGLGRMGGNMALRLVKRGHRVVGFDLSPQAVDAHAKQGAVGAGTWDAFVKTFEKKPRVMWIMVPAGDPTTQAIDRLNDLAPDDGGLVHTGPEGSGHFVKMVHNGIEYGLMQAYAEGFQVMKSAKSFPGMDMRAIAEAWRTGSVVRSWLLDLVARGLAEDPELAGIKGWVEDTGEGRWTVEAAIEESVPTPVIAESLFARFRSRMENTFGDRMLAMMRAQFGGHAVVKESPPPKW